MTGESLKLDALRPCLEGAIPSALATCAPDGTPNISFLSQVEYVDAEHVALTFQFFNTTRRNVLANPQAALLLANPQTGSNHRLAVRYLRTETSGPLFERMKAKLAGIASHEGMSGVFRLQGSDIYRVLAIETLPGSYLPAPPPRRSLLAASRACSERIARCTDLDGALDAALASLESDFSIRHAMILMYDAGGARLYTVASRGYPRSGVGSEVALGEGIIGVAARELTPIRIGFSAPEYAYSRAVRDATAASGLAPMLEREIPFAGLAEPRSQLAVPFLALRRLVGVLYVEAAEELHFGDDDEDALASVAGQLGMSIQLLQAAQDAADEPAGAPAADAQPACPDAPSGPVVVRHFAENDSVFLDDGYLIKGVAGQIFWAIVSDYARQRRTDFSNRELRLDPRIRLPELADNLEARLILLERRLAERDACVRLDKTGRGRFRLRVNRPLELVDVPRASH